MLGKLYTLSTDSSSQIRDLATKLLGSLRTLTGITEKHQIIPLLSLKRTPNKGHSPSHAGKAQRDLPHQLFCAITHRPPLLLPIVLSLTPLQGQHLPCSHTRADTCCSLCLGALPLLSSLRCTLHLQVFAKDSFSLTSLFKTATPLSSMTYPPSHFFSIIHTLFN